MSELTIFQFEEGRVVRTLERDGELWFVAKDVAEALGYTWNGTQRIEHVPEEWRGVTSVVTPSGRQEMAVISEQGLYFFLGRSGKDTALPFQKWIAGDVVPSIRKKGYYAVPQLQERLDAMTKQLALFPAVLERLERMEITQQRIEVEVLTSQTIQMRQLKSYLFDKIVITENRKDYVEFQQLYYDHGRYVSDPILRDAFAPLVTYLCPKIKVRKYKGILDFTGCWLKTPYDREKTKHFDSPNLANQIGKKEQGWK